MRHISRLPLFLSGLAGQGSLTLGMAMLLDVLAHATRVTGQSREGLMVGVFALAEKGAYAFAPLLVGLLLGAMGFISSTTGTVAQPVSAVLAARLAMSLIPACIGVVALIAIYVVVNLHHYLMDTVLWRRENPKTRYLRGPI